MPRSVSFVFPVAAAVFCVGFSISAARADVKVVSQTTVSGATPQMAAKMPAGGQTVTTYYKGSKTRTEAGSGATRQAGITIYDSQANTVTTINPAQKTYTVTSLSALAMNPMMAALDIKTTATMKPGGKTQTILGKPSKNYLWQATITMGMKPNANPGGGGAAGAGKMPTGPLFIMKMNGEQWTTEAVKLPSVGGKALLPGLMSGPARMMPGLAPLLNKLSGMKGLPLSSTVTQTFTQGAAMAGMGGAGAGQIPKEPFVTRTQVMSISEAPLPDSLFAPPAGFRKVENKMPGIGKGQK